eukprot:jgi/Tetstr1/442888/TSEL_030951.t1
MASTPAPDRSGSRRRAPRTDMRSLRKSLAGRVGRDLSDTAEVLGENALWWGNWHYCDELLSQPAGCPDGMALLACERERATLLNSGVVPELIKAIEWGVGYGQGDTDVARLCCMALADLCIDSKSTRLAAVAAGAARVITAVLQRSTDTDVVNEAERAYALLACEAKGRTALAKHGNSQFLLRTSLKLNKGQVMTKRSLDVFDYRLELYASEDSSITGTCPRTSPNKDPTRSDRWRKMKAKKMYLGAKREVKQLRWHRGKYDDLGRATVDATERMPCKGALMRTCTRVGDREVICVKHPRGQLADVYISQIKRMHSNTQPSNFLTADLINMGCDNLTAIIQELCNEEERVTSNELTDVLAASLRFTFSMICFLRAAVSARMISHPEHYCSLLRSGVTNMSSLTRHCKQQVEPIGIEPEHGNIDAMLEALTAELRVGVHLQDFPTPGGSALFPLDAATRAKLGAPVHLGYDQGSHRVGAKAELRTAAQADKVACNLWASRGDLDRAVDFAREPRR